MKDTISLCITAVLLFAIAVGGPVGCWMHDTDRVTEMVLGGADPIAAACSVAGEDGHKSPMCVAYATRH